MINEQERELYSDGVPITSIGESPIQHLMKSVMGYECFFYELYDNPERVERLLHLMETARLKRVEVVAESPAVTVQVGGNWASSIHIPVFERYMIPWFCKVSEILHGADKLVQMHVDGEMKGLFPPFRAYRGLIQSSW